MSDLTDFLNARIAEDQAAVEASGPDVVAWLTYRQSDGSMAYTTVGASSGDGEWVASGAELPDPQHVQVVYDPVRVLAECAAKRALIREVSGYSALGTSTARRLAFLRSGSGAYLDLSGEQDREAATDSTPGDEEAARSVLRGVVGPALLSHLAAVYADHPDYRPEWAQETR